MSDDGNPGTPKPGDPPSRGAPRSTSNPDNTALTPPCRYPILPRYKPPRAALHPLPQPLSGPLTPCQPLPGPFSPSETPKGSSLSPKGRFPPLSIALRLPKPPQSSWLLSGLPTARAHPAEPPSRSPQPLEEPPARSPAPPVRPQPGSPALAAVAAIAGLPGRPLPSPLR